MRVTDSLARRPPRADVHARTLGLARFHWRPYGRQRAQDSVDRAFGNQLDAWASGLGDWGECEADDDDEFDEPGAWRDSVALGDCDA